MDFNKDYFMTMEPQKYWQPATEDNIELDIIEHPNKYNEYIGSFKKDGEWARMIWDGTEVVIQSRSI